jgi:GntR family transcriptional regulator
MELDRLGPQPLYRQLAAELRRRILSGQYPPDRPLPPKPAICEEFGVSMRTVNDALRVLREDGMVVTQVGKGVFVTRRSKWRT